MVVDAIAIVNAVEDAAVVEVAVADTDEVGDMFAVVVTDTVLDSAVVADTGKVADAIADVVTNPIVNTVANVDEVVGLIGKRQC